MSNYYFRGMYSGPRRYNTFIFTTGWLAIGVALVVLTGWQFNIQAFKAIIPGLTPMNPVTALCFILSGAWVMLYTKPYHVVRDVIAAAVLLVGLLHFVTYFVKAPGIRMDFLLYGDVIRKSGIPNSIAPNTALNLFLCGIAMLLTGRGRRNMQLVRQALLLLSFVLAYISLLGYIFNIQPAYRFGGLTPMALITTINFLFIIGGLLFSDTRYGLIHTFASPLNGGKLMRRLIPLVLALPPFINYIVMIGGKRGWYSAEFATQLSTFAFTVLLLIIISSYAVFSNLQQSFENEQASRISSLLQSINEGILETDDQGYIVYVNGAFEKILGYTAEELRGKLALDIIIPGKDRAKFDERIERRKQGIEESYISELVDKKGEKKQISLHAKPLYTAEGKFKSILVSIRDISEELRNLQDIKAFTDFAAHDLKAPLVNLSMLVDLAKSMEIPPQQVQVLEMMEESTNKMRDLIDNLLQFSRIGAAELTREKVGISNLVNCVLKDIDTRDHKIVIDRLPDIQANKSTCTQLFHNLVGNAVKYSSKAGQPEVRIGSYDKGGIVWFFVEDNGIGIDPKFLPQLFQPFKRFTNKFKGNGLGLAIVKRIIEKHGGSIEATIPEKGGMRFDFTLTPEQRRL